MQCVSQHLVTKHDRLRRNILFMTCNWNWNFMRSGKLCTLFLEVDIVIFGDKMRIFHHALVSYKINHGVSRTILSCSLTAIQFNFTGRQAHTRNKKNKYACTYLSYMRNKYVNAESIILLFQLPDNWILHWFTKINAYETVRIYNKKFCGWKICSASLQIALLLIIFFSFVLSIFLID